MSDTTATGPGADSSSTTTGGIRRETQLGWLIWRFLTAAGNRLGVVVAPGATTVSVTWERVEPTTQYGVTALPNWNTTVYLTARSTTGITLTFGTAAPGGGGAVDIVTFRS